ncbi:MULTISPECIES: hypothetical protein [Streptomyces]|uniref:Uncharacterized protein n=2 Tax=Streptomyces TaxID=1883 RepID=A0A8I0P7E4_9ACTN|nr:MULTISPECIES: hypothetical protein [Streptomyces]KND43818.1 hypothetical protein IQ64_16055 [Streptomyces stelliscabiei]MBE1596628.1 hypothetical protein [Streptomyces stelliscabiei]MDX2517960.1 hypothetical protein [Streptomyces stelliscabiei]BBC30568.1 uncharacterized protein SGFS_018620 [Streptomyces graminofaciens]
MNTVRARVWQFEIVPGAGGDPSVHARKLGGMALPVHLARLVHINALACDFRRVVDYRIRVHEARLLTSYLAAPSGLALQVDYSSLLATSLHVRRFISECAGLGVMTAGSEKLFSWKPGRDTLHSFDVLPPGPLQTKYGTFGVRPDLLFHLPNGPVAGEARGRHREAKTLFPKSPDSNQKERLLQLAAWSADLKDHPYFMSWVWIGATGVGVDIFIPKAGWWGGDGLQLGAIQEEYEPDWWIEPPRRVRRSELDDGMDGRLSVPRRGRTRTNVVAIRDRTDERVEGVLDTLYRTAGPTVGSFAGVPVRGSWAPADELGTARHDVLIGILAEYPSGQRRARRRPEGIELAGKRADVHLEGRLLTVVRETGGTWPSWAQLEEELLEV